MSEGFFIHQFQLGPWDNFIYLIGDRASRTCAVVDPAWNHEVILEEAERLGVRITDLLCTHSHFDHINEVETLLGHIDARVHMMREEQEHSGFRCENLIVHRSGDVVSLGKHTEVTMVHSPGHTPGSVCYHLPETLVTGDTMFVDGCGRCDFVGGDPKVMFETLKMLTTKLPGDTVMYPGHNYGNTPTSKLDEQLETNPYLKLKTLDDFVKHRMAGKTPNTKPLSLLWPPSDGIKPARNTDKS
jgi:glyoxylase-like metal-dependent hydrolase (beta-lactamase superfamily II)